MCVRALLYLSLGLASLAASGDALSEVLFADSLSVCLPFPYSSLSLLLFAVCGETKKIIVAYFLGILVVALY